MRSMKVYIAGCVTGLPREEAIKNFERGKMILLKNTHDFVNPIDLVPENSSPGEAMKLCLPAVIDCDAILMLTDYKFSEGAQVEKQLARYCGKKILYEEDLR